jgi:hypothetical protein
MRNPFEISIHEVGEDIYGFQEELFDIHYKLSENANIEQIVNYIFIIHLLRKLVF